MSLIYYKISAALLILAVSIAAVIYPLKKKSILKTESLGLGEALASGIFLGTAFFHMLPDAVKLFNGLYGQLTYPIPEIICVFGFLLLLFLERLSYSYASVSTSKHSIPYLLAFILILHAIIEGAALGIGSTISETIMLFIAILAHKGSESFALCITLLRYQIPFRRIVFIVIFAALMTPLGIGLGATINLFTFARNGQLVAALFNAFAAGTFLYISTLHHIHFHKHEEESQGLLEFACLALGCCTMGVIAIWS